MSASLFYNPAVENIMPADGYKLGHVGMFPHDTEAMQSNWTARGSRIDGQTWVCFVGLQVFLQRRLMDDMQVFFDSDIEETAQDYADEVNAYLGTTEATGDHVRDLHALGYLPLEFRALPEGTLVPLRVPMFVVENTIRDPRYTWLVNYFETLLSCEMWGSCTSATTALRFRALFEDYAFRTGSPQEFVQWQGHDFSMRGMMGLDAAKLSGMGHLVAFTGTDTLPAIPFIRRYYDTPKGILIGGSVNATEHSVVCTTGEDREYEDYYERLLFDVFPTGILSMVSDTWDLWRVLTVYLPLLKDRILARNGKLVIRPDSGDPVKIICGDPAAPEGSPQRKGVIQLLWEVFGGTETSTGHKLLDSHVGVIYGDGIDFGRANAILARLAKQGFASANMVFGLGSYTYQYVTRDTYNFAMKATWVQRLGVGHDIFKNPVTDNGMKKSATGRLAVQYDDDGDLFLINSASDAQEYFNEHVPVWRDGKFLIRRTWPEITERALGQLHALTGEVTV
jgi:nicotinamide phosphoribosyltransferase